MTIKCLPTCFSFTLRATSLGLSSPFPFWSQSTCSTSNSKSDWRRLAMLAAWTTPSTFLDFLRTSTPTFM
jgi:hypothetical protein